MTKDTLNQPWAGRANADTLYTEEEIKMTPNEFVNILKKLSNKNGKLEVINFLVKYCSLNLPDAVLVYKTFIYQLTTPPQQEQIYNLQ